MPCRSPFPERLPGSAAIGVHCSKLEGLAVPRGTYTDLEAIIKAIGDKRFCGERVISSSVQDFDAGSTDPANQRADGRPFAPPAIAMIMVPMLDLGSKAGA
jgi:hypothetical protein